jgi:dTDP-4-amino-4,6-dideoxygalactose transaminase
MIPLIRPRPPRLSEAPGLLRQIENSGIFSNFGPANARFERDMTERMFGGTGACMTVCNATLGLMLAIRHATQGRRPEQIYALMPSFTFAAAAQAALWCGLIPLFCDIDPVTWAADAGAEDEMLQRHAGAIAVVVPYATFGFDIDLQHYERLGAEHGVPVVVDAAASLGTVSAVTGLGFGAGFSGAVVYSMHATKSFAAGEGGVIHSGDEGLIADLRVMANFGFGQPRTATMAGLNAKLSEVGALSAHLRLLDYESVIHFRSALVARYRAGLPSLVFQGEPRMRQAHQFAAALLPRWAAGYRDALQARLAADGIGMATYFSPHVAEQPYFAGNSQAGSLAVTADIASRIVSLPLYDDMRPEDVDSVVACVTSALAHYRAERGYAAPKRRLPAVASRRPSAAEGVGRAAWDVPAAASSLRA